MTAAARRARAWKALLILASTGSVTVYHRGINEKGEELYEVRLQNGDKFFQNVTEAELVAGLTKEEKEG